MCNPSHVLDSPSVAGAVRVVYLLNQHHLMLRPTQLVHDNVCSQSCGVQPKRGRGSESGSVDESEGEESEEEAPRQKQKQKPSRRDREEQEEVEVSDAYRKGKHGERRERGQRG
eukprot:1161864-Pelagomonas_calceolata.AAC.26